MTTIEKMIEKYNEFVTVNKTISGDFPAFAFDDVELLENEKFSFSNCETFNFFVSKYRDRKEIREAINDFSNNVFGTGSRCLNMSRGNDRMKQELGLDWCEFYSLLLANLFTREAAKVEVIYVLTYFAFAE